MSFLGKSQKNRSELPKDFAEQILKNDITLMMSKYQDSMALNNLIQLYMKGVEYYESQKDQKSEYFKSKLNWIMSHPIIISPKKQEEQLDKEQTKKIDFKIHTNFEQIQHYEDVTSFENPTEKSEIDTQLNKAIIPIQNNEVKQMIDNLKMETTKINQIIQNDLDSQKTKIADRIHKRSKSFVNKNKYDQDE
ncbi:unnamed protein product (macronuclear) [Paramecium tetraurelia]|uniref:Uncharacterized protein n=1 Tax=Paramecium tetraurelia TaxID=5888 RepID=A0BEW0_PARTE|nr:uncharacterized protein GSPATT00028111001 [Paramecium tetraurelia]CAK57077.1 unnamed protein product [Paramecium tetraurelia]|eukprot:XP_001424475.1 hypothetical protein (macronuclear) [Paramecium tetraurelia strain d4-2]